MLRALSFDQLEEVSGGFRWEGLRPSDNVEDLRGQPNPFSATEDGLLIGPRGEVYPDTSINESFQQTESPWWSPTEDGFTVDGQGNFERNPSMNMHQPQESPLSADDQQFMSQALDFQHVDDSPAQPETQWNAGEFVEPAWQEWEQQGGGGSFDEGGSFDGGGSSDGAE